MRKKFLIYFLGNFGSKFLNLIMIPIFTIFINPKEFGSFDYWLTLSNLLVVILGLNFHVATYLDLIKHKNKLTISEKISSMSKFVIWQTVAIIIIFILYSLLFSYSIYLLLVCLIVLNSNIYEFLNQGILRGLEKNKNMAISSFIFAFFTSLITLFFIILHEYMNLNIKYSYLLLIAQIIGTLFSNIYIILIFMKMNINLNIKQSILSLKDIKGWMMFSVPMIINALSWWIIYLSGRIFVVNYLGAEENGIYSIASRFPSILYMLNIIFSMVWQDKAIDLNDKINKSQLYTKQLKNYIHIQFLSLILLTIIFKFLLPFILKNEYSSGIPYIPLLTFATVLAGIGSFYAAFYYSTSKSFGAIFSSILGILIFLITIRFYIESLELYAVSLAMVLGYFGISIYRIFEFKKKLNIQFPFFTTIIYTIIFVCAYVTLYY